MKVADPNQKTAEEYMRLHAAGYCYECIAAELELDSRSTVRLIQPNRDASRVWAPKTCAKCGNWSFCVAWVA